MKLQVILFLTILSSQLALAASSCKEKRRTMVKLRDEHRECLKAWQDSFRGIAADPTDDCGSKQAEFVQSMKELKACLREAKEAKK